ncbi:MAG: hypothetical protein HOO00_09330 [Rhodospirillaceae bacterium]|jgi:hypothetical protein|nr:hypothetical protein [Rhodospirillaceae bacterium]MBT5374331.1 hypothetical protein [Rhodospirillaceae bacterium]MBT5658788.1 hypothetical protein [Rhodospirillaceae bacterium]MBT5752582.1 hypothetical protein [Rhodospirillaceae bacterium]
MKNIAYSFLLLVFVLFGGLSGTASASDWKGVWKVSDSQGQPFYITLLAGGTAASNLEGGIFGTWTTSAGKAVISWGGGWHSVISHDGGASVKRAYKPGSAMDGTPTNTSDAVKVDQVPWR